jgi:hypothetical protein
VSKAGIVQDSLAACGFETRSQIIWAKNNFANSILVERNTFTTPKSG